MAVIPLNIMFQELQHALECHVPDSQVAQRNGLTFTDLDWYRAEFHRQFWQLPQRRGSDRPAIETPAPNGRPSRPATS